MFELNHEIEKYKECLKNLRPKPCEPQFGNSSARASRSCNSLRIEMPCQLIDDNEIIASQFNVSTKRETEERMKNETQSIEKDDQHDKRSIDKEENKEIAQEERYNYFMKTDSNYNHIFKSLSPPPIDSHHLIDESCISDGIDVEHMVDISGDSIAVSECSSAGTVYMPMPKDQQSNEDFELIIKPTIMVNIQESCRRNFPYQIDCAQSDFQTKLPGFQCEKKIAVNQHMSIFIKNLSNEVNDGNMHAYMSESFDGNDIIREVFNKTDTNNTHILQKYFLRWIHFNTIEKLKRQNPSQTRLQKMEAFLRNITLERKRALNKLRRPGHILAENHGNLHRKVFVHDSTAMESPRLLMRTYNNK